jgi:hypothetical protein
MKILTIAALMTVIPLAVWAQDYVEATGQTFVFNLQAGATAGWNQNGSAVLYGPAAGTAMSAGIRLFPDARTFAITFSGPEKSNAIFELFTIGGKRVAQTALAVSRKSFSLAAPLAPGCYRARIMNNTATVYSTSLFVTR